MLVVAHAHVDEWKAAAALERALWRVAVTLPNHRRHRAALIAYREAFDVHGRARARHSRWYRAYRRARR